MAETYVPSDGGGFPLADLPDTTVQVKRTKSGPIVHDAPSVVGAAPQPTPAFAVIDDKILPASQVDPAADILTQTAQARTIALRLRDERDAATVAFEDANAHFLMLAAEARKTLAGDDL